MALVILADSAANAQMVTRGGDFSIDINRHDGRLVTDLGNDLWLLAASGGEATLLIDAEAPLARPSWSADGRRILYHALTDTGTNLYLYSAESGESVPIGSPSVHNQDGAWHPSTERIVFASDRNAAGLDIWEMDLSTGLEWRLTRSDAEEFDPTWSASGEHLAWISFSDDRYRLMLRRRGQPDRVLVESEVPLSVPSFRPDGSLLSYQRAGIRGPALEFVILSNPPLVRVFENREKLSTAGVSWQDRMNYFYTADGQIRKRGFEDRVSRPVHFRANPQTVARREPEYTAIPREIEIVDPAAGVSVIRAERLFDGVWPGYRDNVDIVIEDGRIRAIEPERDRQNELVLDLGRVTAIPGLIDSLAPMPESTSEGPAILAWGVTTIAVTAEALAFDPTIWESEALPGPRVILYTQEQGLPPVSGRADAGLIDMDRIAGSRQAITLGQTSAPLRRFASPPLLPNPLPLNYIAGSRPNGLPPGNGLLAELLAIQAAGARPESVLHAAGRNASGQLGAEGQVGTLTPGAVADLVLVSGDPLADVGEALTIVAIVRNGRLFSLVRLLEMANLPTNVE